LAPAIPDNPPSFVFAIAENNSFPSPKPAVRAMIADNTLPPASSYAAMP
jgi:hypothetical protein